MIVVWAITLAACNRAAAPDETVATTVTASVEPAQAAPARLADFPGTLQGAEQLARALMKPGGDLALTRALQPRPEDYAAVFEAPVAEAIREGSQTYWDHAQALAVTAAETELQVEAASSDELRGGSRVFPDYGPVLAALRPGFLWARFTVARPGQTSGRHYDGLVYVQDHWARFPEPWRHVALTGKATPAECAAFADHFARLMTVGQEGEAARISAEVGAQMKPDLIANCTRQGTRAEIACALAAQSMEALEKCGSNNSDGR